jgi:putative transposase
MRFTAHLERKTTFERLTITLGLIHGRCARHSPWQNGIIKRSHRTDNDELFHRERFTDSEERKYRLRLWEYEYNTRRPHQSLGGRTPLRAFVSDYRFHAAARMLM